MSARILGASVLALFAAVPAMAADYPDFFRPSYETGWVDPNAPDPLDFEIGIRHWYSRGEQKFSLTNGDYSAEDTTQSLELHLRIDDYSTNAYVKANAGYSAVIDGTYSDLDASGQEMMSGKVAYGGLDLGYLAMSNEAGGVGVFAGYQYWNDSPDMGRYNFNTGTGVDSKANDLGIHALRLGVSAKADITDWFDVSAEVAAVPYAYADGIFGAHDTSNLGLGAKTGETEINGWMYGAMGEVMVGIKPTENVALRLGGRAWYLEGTPEATWSSAGAGYITEFDKISVFRYGLLSELTYKF